MIRCIRSILASAAVVATLGACHQAQKSGHGTVSGEILPGSVSDAMLPYDTVKSKPPLAPVQAAGQAGNTPGSDAADSADSTAPADSAAPDAPASPTPIAPPATD